MEQNNQVLTEMGNIHIVNMSRFDDIQNQVDRLENKVDEIITQREYMRQMSVALQELASILKDTMEKIEVVR